ncbi:hypothetical protein GGR57DRAFT_513666 [Xylariaceae sp. FL1272]|nr:hypothetical protein GGR57DRAFT_513666 [Xylariaceae sp. FL1272]
MDKQCVLAYWVLEAVTLNRQVGTSGNALFPAHLDCATLLAANAQLQHVAPAAPAGRVVYKAAGGLPFPTLNTQHLTTPPFNTLPFATTHHLLNHSSPITTARQKQFHAAQGFISHISLPHHLRTTTAPACFTPAMEMATSDIEMTTSYTEMATSSTEMAIHSTQMATSDIEMATGNSQMSTSDTTVGTQCRFKWSSLPVELQVAVLEQSDLVAPDGIVRWTPTRVFGFLRREFKDEKQDKKQYWKMPIELFHVNQDIRDIARRVVCSLSPCLLHKSSISTRNHTDMGKQFFGQNKFVVSFNTRSFYKLKPFQGPGYHPYLQMPRELAANLFLKMMVSFGGKPGFLYLRSLEFQSFSISVWSFKEASTKWFRDIRLIHRCNGMPHLRSVRIAGVNANGLTKVGDPHHFADPITRFRHGVEKLCWKFVTEDGPPLFVSKSLTVQMKYGFGLLYYIMRKAGETGIEPPGTAFKLLGRRETLYRKNNAKVDNKLARSQDGQWVEEAWELRPLFDDE